MLRCQVVVENGLNKEIAKHIVRSQGRKTQKQVDDIVDKRMTIKEQKFVVANKTKWSSKISPNPEALKTRSVNEEERRKFIENEEEKYSAKKRQEEEEAAKEDRRGVTTLRVAPPVPDEKEKVYFQCGKCMQKVPCDRKAFQTTSLDARTWCGKCGKSLMAKTYLCHCGVLWYKCREHKCS